MTKYLPHYKAPAVVAPVTTPHSWERKKTVLRENHYMTPTMWTYPERIKELIEMLTYCRPEDSQTEADFIARFIDSIPGVMRDSVGNRLFLIGDKGTNICWACHTDTVHYDEGRQALRINRRGKIALDADSKASCLGADCGAGVWLMRRMILAGKPGLYIFHRGEERGGKGSKYLAEHGEFLFRKIKFMISLDRKGKDSVITEQFGGITASNEFATSIAPMLPEGFKADPTGSFTDSASYSKIIPECSNLSVGYESCHTKDETLDWQFLDNMLTHLLALDYSRLVAKRDPKAPNVKAYSYNGVGYDSGHDWRKGWDDDDYVPGSYRRGSYPPGRFDASKDSGWHKGYKTPGVARTPEAVKVGGKKKKEAKEPLNPPASDLTWKNDRSGW